MKKLQYTDPRVQEAIVLYKSGKGIKPISKQLHLDDAIIRKFLIEEGLLRTGAEARRNGKSKAQINDEALDILTSEALYWIGFLYADGHIEKGRKRISLTTTEVDLEHLNKFRKFFGKDIPVIRLGSGHFRVAFSSKKIYEKLQSLGFSNRKTYNIITHNLLKISKDFWRGCIDGDGWVYETTLAVIGLSGHENTISEFLKFIELSGIPHKATCNKVKKREFLWQCNLRSRAVVLKVLHLLYKDATVYLDRKYNKYLEIINKPELIYKSLLCEENRNSAARNC